MLTYGMIGGGIGSYIGDVHMHGAEMDGKAKMVAGCFSRHAEKNEESAKYYHLEDKERIYQNYQEMAEKESVREDRIDFAVVATPNNSHFEIVKCMIEHGIAVMCDKPLAISVQEAEELERLAEKHHVKVAVSYGYTGYPVIRQARCMIEAGEIGSIIHVRATHVEDWVIESMPDEKPDRLPWRYDPKIAGDSLCTADLGTHAEQLLVQFTGLHVEKVISMTDRYPTYLSGETNTTVLAQLEGGASAMIWASQIAMGHACTPGIFVIGSKGALEWRHEDPDRLFYTPKGEPTRILEAGREYMTADSRRLTRVSAGHHEGFYEAFGNIYREFIADLEAESEGHTPEHMIYPTIRDGADGVRFVAACMKSSREGNIWVSLKEKD
jgi:predicted dehydrogenase